MKAPVLSIQDCGHVPISVSCFLGKCIYHDSNPNFVSSFTRPWVNHLNPKFIIVNRIGLAI